MSAQSHIIYPQQSTLHMAPQPPVEAPIQLQKESAGTSSLRLLQNEQARHTSHLETAPIHSLQIQAQTSTNSAAPTIQLPVAPSSNNANRTGEQRALIQDTSSQPGAKVQVQEVKSQRTKPLELDSAVPSKGHDNAVQIPYQRAAGLQSISLDTAAANNYRQKLQKHAKLFGAGAASVNAHSPSINHQAQEPHNQNHSQQITKNMQQTVNEQIPAGAAKPSIAQAHSAIEGEDNRQPANIGSNREQQNIIGADAHGAFQGNSSRHMKELRGQVAATTLQATKKQQVAAASQSLGPMNNRVPRQNKSAPSQNSFGSALGPTATALSTNYYLRSGAQKAGVGGPASILAAAVNQHGYMHSSLNSNPQILARAAVQYQSAATAAKEMGSRFNQAVGTNSQRFNNATLHQQHYLYQVANGGSSKAHIQQSSHQYVLNGPTEQQTNLHHHHQQFVSEETMNQGVAANALYRRSHNSLQAAYQNHGKHGAPVHGQENHLPQDLHTSTVGIEDSQALQAYLTQHESSHGSSSNPVAGQISSGQRAAGISTEEIRMQHSSRRKLNNQLCEQMVLAYKQNPIPSAAEDALLQSYNTQHHQQYLQEQEKRHLTEIKPQSDYHQQPIEATNSLLLLGLEQQRSSLPPIPMSPAQQNAKQAAGVLGQPQVSSGGVLRHSSDLHASSGCTESRKRGRGISQGLFPTLPTSSNRGGAVHQSHSLHVDNQRRRGPRGGPEDDRKISNTQIMKKTKTNLFDTGANGHAPHLSGSYDVNMNSGGRAQKRGQVQSVKRTINEKLSSNRADLYGSQSKELLLTGSTNFQQVNEGSDRRRQGYSHCVGENDTSAAIVTIAQMKSARNPQFRQQDKIFGKREPVLDGKAKVRSAQAGGQPSKKQQHRQQQYSNKAAGSQNPFSSSGGSGNHDAERFVQQCVTGSNGTVSSDTRNNQLEQNQGAGTQQNSMGKTTLSIIGKPQHFTPVKHKLRLTFNQPLNRDNLNQQHQHKHLKVAQKRNVVAAHPTQEEFQLSEGNAASGQIPNVGQGGHQHRNAIYIRHEKRNIYKATQGGQRAFGAGQSDNSSTTGIPQLSYSDPTGMGYQPTGNYPTSVTNNTAQNQHNPSKASTGPKSTVKNMMRAQLGLNASSEKVPRRALMMQSRPDSAQDSAAGVSQASNSYLNSQQMIAEHGDQKHPYHGASNHDLEIIENNSSMLQSQEKIRQQMRGERDMYLEQLKRNNGEPRFQIQNQSEQQPNSFESPSKIQLGSPSNPGGGSSRVDYSAKLAPAHFSTGKIPMKNWTEEKPQPQSMPQQTPETYNQQPSLQSKAISWKNPSRPNVRVPNNTMEKQNKIEEVERSSAKDSSPLIIKMQDSSNHSSADEEPMAQGEPQSTLIVPRVSFSRLQSQQLTNDGAQLEMKIDDQNPEELSELDFYQPDGSEIPLIAVKKNIIQTAAEKSLAVSSLESPEKRHRNRSQQQDKARSVQEHRTEIAAAAAESLQVSGGAAAAGFESTPNKASRLGSAQTAQQERSPKMGDITNITRQQSEVDIPQAQPALSATEKQLSFRQFKNPHRNIGKQRRERSVEKSSQDEAIGYDIVSEVYIENSDEYAQSQGAAAQSQFLPTFKRAASGHAFSCVFDADSEGPKRDKSQVQIDKLRRQELQTVKRGEPLGQGSFGVVYQGLYDGASAQSQNSSSYGSDEIPLPPQMAIKVVKVEDKRFMNKLEHELELLRTLKHKNIVQYYGCLINEEQKEASIFMELMPNSLQTQYRGFGPLHEKVIRRHTRQILEALCYLHNHELRIIHGDLKAANILSDKSVVKLTDFGDSRKLEALPQDLHASGESGAVLNEFKGSILWMAPECFTGSPVGRRSDIWSLGCTLIELASARHPWHGIRDLYHLIQKLEMQELPDIPESLSPTAKDFICKCLNYEKDQRPTAVELMQHPFINDGSIQQTPAQQSDFKTNQPAAAASDTK